MRISTIGAAIVGIATGIGAILTVIQQWHEIMQWSPFTLGSKSSAQLASTPRSAVTSPGINSGQQIGIPSSEASPLQASRPLINATSIGPSAGPSVSTSFSPSYIHLQSSAVATPDAEIHPGASAKMITLPSPSATPSYTPFRVWIRAKDGLQNRVALSSISFDGDGRTGVVVGDEGLILISHDSGETWHSPRGPRQTSQNLRSVSISKDGRIGVAVGENGIILVTHNSGSTWNRRDRESHIERGTLLLGVSLSADGTLGFISGNSGTVHNRVLLKTGNSGNTWDYIEAANYVGQGIAISADGRVGLINNGGTLAMTDDSGETWKVAYSSKSSAYPDVYIEQFYGVALSSDGTTGIAVGTLSKRSIGPIYKLSEFPIILVTTDSGSSWTKWVGEREGRLESVALSGDGKVSVASGGPRLILVTANSGATWTSIPFVDGGFSAVALSSDGRKAWGAWSAIYTSKANSSPHPAPLTEQEFEQLVEPHRQRR